MKLFSKKPTKAAGAEISSGSSAPTLVEKFVLKYWAAPEEGLSEWRRKGNSPELFISTRKNILGKGEEADRLLLEIIDRVMNVINSQVPQPQTIYEVDLDSLFGSLEQTSQQKFGQWVEKMKGLRDLNRESGNLIDLPYEYLGWTSKFIPPGLNEEYFDYLTRRILIWGTDHLDRAVPYADPLAEKIGKRISESVKDSLKKSVAIQREIEELKRSRPNRKESPLFTRHHFKYFKFAAGSSTELISRVFLILGQAARPNVATATFESAFAQILKATGAAGYFKGYKHYPCFVSTSVNEEVVHTLPSQKVLASGDLLKLQAGLKVNGEYAYMAATIQIGNVDEKYVKLQTAALYSLLDAREIIKAGVKVSDISKSMDESIRNFGFFPDPNFGGYQMGASPMMPPFIPCFHDPANASEDILTEGMVVSLIAIAHESPPELIVGADTWGVYSKGGDRSAIFTQMIRVTGDGYIRLTDLPEWTSDIVFLTDERRTRIWLFEKSTGQQKDLQETAVEAIRTGQTALAYELWRFAAKQGNTQAQYDLGVMFANGSYVVKNKREALKWFLKAAENGHSPAMFVASHLYVLGEGGVERDYQKALSYLEKAAELGHPEAQEKLIEVRRLCAETPSQPLHEKNTPPWMKTYVVETSEGMQSLRIDPKTGYYLVEDLGRKEDPLLAESRQLMALGKYQEAIGILQRMVLDNPNNTEALFSVGACLASMGKLNLARETMEHVIAIDPDHLQAQYNLAYLLHDLGDYEKAIKSYERALEISPDHVWSRIRMGDTYKEMGNIQDAYECYRNASEVYEKKPKISVNLEIPFKCFMAMADCLTLLGRAEEAKNQYVQATEIAPKSFDAQFELAKAYHALGKYRQALDIFQKILSWDEKVIDLHCFMASCFFGLQLSQEGERELVLFERLKAANPQLSKILTYAKKDNQTGLVIIWTQGTSPKNKYAAAIPSEKIHIPLGILDIFEDLLSYLRYFATNMNLINALIEIGSQISSPKVNPRTMLKETSNILESLKGNPAPGKHREIADYLQTKYLSRTSGIAVNESDFGIFKIIFDALRRLFVSPNTTLIQDFADTFHGFPFAVRNTQFDRGQYFIDYIQPFMERWAGFFTDAETRAILAWKGIIGPTYKRDRLQSAAKYAGHVFIKVTSDGTVRDGHRRIKAAIDAKQTVNTVVIP